MSLIKAKDDYDGMIAAALKATKSDEVTKIIKYIQTHFTVPTNFEKHVRSKWEKLEKRKIDVVISPPKQTNKRPSSTRPVSTSLSPDSVKTSPATKRPLIELSVCSQWRDVAMDKGLRREVRLSSLTFLPFSLLRGVLKESASVLCVLDLSGSPVTDRMASLLAQKPPATLKRLHTLNISRCSLLNPTGCYHLFSAFSSAVPSLTSLSVAECKLDDSVVNQFISKFTNLKFLDISRIWTISTGAIFNITQNCTKLQRINMVNLTFLFDSAIASLAENCKNLSHVDMSCCYGLTSNTLTYLNEHPLQFLSIQSISVNSTFALPSTLKQLDMSKCTAITDGHLIPIIQSCTQLESLSIASCPDITDSSLDLISQHLSASLTSFSISGCLSLTPKGIENTVPHFTRLTDLYIAHLNLTDTFFVNHMTSFPNLKTLDVSHNTRVTDATIQAIASACPWLQVLVCDGLQTASAPALPALKKCGITAESLAHLRKNCKYLRALSMSGTVGVDIHSTHLIALVKACTYLEHVVIGDCTSPSGLLSDLQQKVKAASPLVKVTCR